MQIFYIAFLLILFFISPLLNSNVQAQSNWNWTQTSNTDFRNNTLTNLSITDDGEVKFNPPLTKTVATYRNNSLDRHISRDSYGNYLKCWIENSNIYAQKFDSTGKAITDVLQIDDPERFVGNESKFRSALMNDGSFIVAWRNHGYQSDGNFYGQIFASTNIKVSNNFQINSTESTSGNFPSVFANEVDATFWIFYSYRTNSLNHNNIFYQRRNKEGSMVGSISGLLTGRVANLELQPVVAKDNNNNFIVCWYASNSGISNDSQIYARKFNSAGEPISNTKKINEFYPGYGASVPAISIDKDNNYLIAWIDERDLVELSAPYTINVYAQLLDFNDQLIGENFKINESIHKSHREIDIDYFDNEFQISYLAHNISSNNYETYITKWKYEQITSGSMISSVFDTGPGGSEFIDIIWDESTTDNSEINFKIRSVQNKSNINGAVWYGPTNSSDYYTTAKEEKINIIHLEDRFVQYKAVFDSYDTLSLPILHSVSILYLPADTIPPSVPKNFQIIPGHSNNTLTWSENSESDLMGYNIYRGLSSLNYDPTFTKRLHYSQTTFLDSSAISGEIYFYTISAVDSSHNFCSLTKELSSTPSGKTYYVKVDNNNSGDGNLLNPYNSINKAMDKAIFGDKIIVMPGIYKERVSIKNGVHLQSSGLEPAIIKSIDNNEMILMNSNTKLEGFIILQSHSGLVIFAQGIGISIIKNNIISEVNGPPGTAIMCRNSEAEISQNYISSFYTAIQGSGGLNTELRSNIDIHNNIIKCFWGVSIGDDCETEIYNNTIILGNEQGEYGRGVFARFSDDLNVLNNIFVSATKENGVVIKNDGSTTTTITSSYNNFWNHSIKYDGPVNELSGCINLDPLFEDYNNNDFRLKENSPCIDAGNTQEKYFDLDSTRNDMGAYGGKDPFNNFNNLETIKKLSVQNCSGFPGDTISTFISLDSPDSLFSATLKLEFDSSILTYLRSTLTNTTSSFSIDDKLNSSNQININMEGKVTPEYESNNILELSFIVKSNLYSGDASPLTIVNTDLLSESLSTIFLTSITDGVFVVNLGSKDGKYVYVDINSSETQNGNRTNPFQSLQDAIDFSNPEDTIIVAPGEYFGPFTMKDSVFLKGSGASVTELNIDFDLFFDVPVLSFYSVNHSAVSGFTIHSQEFMEAAAIYCNNSSPAIKENYLVASFINADASAIICNNQSNPFIERNTTENCKISIFNSDPVIINNTLKGSAGGMSSVEISENSKPIIKQNIIYAAEAGVGIFNSNPIIENNKIVLENFGGQGIYINKSDSCIIRNNIILDSGEDGNGFFIKNSSNINIINNTIATNRTGIWSLSSSGSIVNNIIMGNSSAGILAPDFTNIDYNCLWNNTADYENTTSGNNDIHLNPLFENNSFNLAESSPCINTGISNQEFNDVDGSRNDIGAFGGPFADLDWVKYESCNLEINNKSEYLSDTIYVAINGSNVANIANIDLSLSYDNNVLEFLNAESTDLTKSFSVSKSLAYSNNVDLDLTSRNGIKSDSGSVILLSFLSKSESSTKTYINFKKANLVDDVLTNRSVSQLKDGEINIIVTDLMDNKIPQSFHISQNYPNPFNPSTMLEYSLPQKSFVELNIYDILGRQVEKLVNSEKLAGNHKIVFNADKLSSGIYFYRIKAGTYSKTMKMVLIR